MERISRPMFFGLLAALLLGGGSSGCALGPNQDCALAGADCGAAPTETPTPVVATPTPPAAGQTETPAPAATPTPVVTTPTPPAEAFTDCNDKLDNDGDGFIDLEDEGCTSVFDESEVNEAAEDDVSGRWGCTHPYDNAIESWFADNGVPYPVQLDDTDDDGTRDQVWVDGSIRILYWSELGMLDLDNDHRVDSAAWDCKSWGDGTNDYADDDGDGYSENEGDLDDEAPGNNPGAKDACGDGLDNDYDGVLDEECQNDVDSDGESELEGDCNDATAFVGQGAYEYNDGVDNDCDCTEDSDGDGRFCDEGDANVDEKNTIDGDGDGYCEAATCTDGSKGGDCNDAAASINPGATDYGGDGNDNDCDGSDT